MKFEIQRAVVMVLCCYAGSAFAQKSQNENLIPNAGFEQSISDEDAHPAEWICFTSKDQVLGITDSEKHSGSRSLKITAQETPNAYQGINYTFPIHTDTKYTFSVYVMNDKSNPLKSTAHGMLVIEWKAADNKEISRTLSKSWDQSLSKMRWEQFSLNNVKPPKGAVSATAGIHLCDGESGGKGSVFLDDALLIEK